MHFSIFRPIYMLMSRVHLHQIGWQTAGRSGDFLLSFSFCVIKGAVEQLDMAAQAHPFTSIQLSVFPRAVSQERTAWYGECAAGFNGSGRSFMADGMGSLSGGRNALYLQLSQIISLYFLVLSPSLSLWYTANKTVSECLQECHHNSL